MASSARIDELRKKFEENPRRYFAPLANEYRKAGQIDQAIAICREYLPQQPGHMSGHIVYGQALYEARQFEEAKGVFETALSLDPENLIALRHLGDIALLIGDSDAARLWYRRVLEADPRNEEIQAQLLALEQSITAPADSPAQPGTAETGPISSSTPTMVVDARSESGAPDPSQPPRASGEVRRQPWARKTPTASTSAQSAPTPPSNPAAPAVPAAPAAPVAATPVTNPVMATAATAEIVPPRVTKEEFVREPQAATTVPIETASVAGLETTSLTASLPTPEPPLSSPAPATPLTSVPPERAESAVPRLSLLDVPSVSEPSTSPPESGPFVTETMAELYLQQGHREEALRVYRALLEQRPGDGPLRGRVTALEAELAPRPERTSVESSALPESTVPATPAGSAAEATIREVLETIAQRRPGFPPRRRSGNGGAPPATGEGAPRVNRDGLASLFQNVEIAAADESAALVLALAFTEVHNGAQAADASPLTGAPAHPAANELSLETVFGSGQSAPGGSVSYDQFFAQRPSGPQTGSVDPRDDVAHFTKWLDGLKRR